MSLDIGENFRQEPLVQSHEVSEKCTQRTPSTIDVSQTLLNQEEERRIIRKIDVHLLPILLVATGLQFLDKTSLSFSAILVPQHLVEENYNWTSSIFYVGYLAACYPIVWCFVKSPLGKFLSIIVLIQKADDIAESHGEESLHSIPSLGTTDLIILRVFLGALESPLTARFSLITSIWYTPREHVSRHCFWFAGNSVMSILGSLMGYGILRYHGPLAQFRTIFLLLGAMTVAWGVLRWFLLPDKPETAYFLSPSEKSFTALRPRKFQRTSQLKRWSQKQFYETLRDPKSWWFLIFHIVTGIPAGGITTFSAIIIQGFGSSLSQTVLMTMPTSVFVLVGVIVVAGATPRLSNSRFIVMAILELIAMAGRLVIVLLPQEKKFARLIGLWMLSLVGPSLPLMFSIVASNTAGFTKKATTSCMLFIGYCVGNIVGPQFFLAKEAPRYEVSPVSLLKAVLWFPPANEQLLDRI
ncbi:putative transporter [Lachnellula subtilissima]|uniref:Putative transporter n=1 Tax=Lachnellula subtilissima TaxID=602034 RepID=A0A8H8RH19_9HELO|nr:putative transporter [Lachnellula subtilissima]